MKEKLDIRKRIGRPRFAHIYGIILLIATIGLAFHVLYNLWLTPRIGTGTPMLGYRMEGIPELNESWVTATVEFGGNQAHVDYVEIFPTTGPVIYFNVRVEEGTSLSKARSAATDIVEHFIEISNEVARDYSLQVVVSYGDIAAQKEENQAAVTAHVHEYNRSFAESTLEYAERYPSRANVSRAEININTRLTESIIIAGGEEELERMRTRFEAITVMTEEQEQALIDEQGHIPSYSGLRQVPPTDISDFPNWGVWNNRRSRINWN
jgi:hypothetical protein